MQSHPLTIVAICLTFTTSSGCGTKPVTDPLAGVGGYRLVYKQREGKTVGTVQIERALRARINVKDASEVVVQRLDDGGCEIRLPGASEKRAAEIKKIIASSNVLQFRIVAMKGKDDKLIAACQDGKDHEGALWIDYDPEMHKDFSPEAVLTTNDGKSKVLVLIDAQPVDAGHLQTAMQGRDESNRPCINCFFTTVGAARMQRLTSMNLERQLAIIIGGKLINAPTIQSPFGTSCCLTGNFTEDEVVSLVIPLRQALIFADLESSPVFEEKVEAGSKK